MSKIVIGRHGQKVGPGVGTWHVKSSKVRQACSNTENQRNANKKIARKLTPEADNEALEAWSDSPL